MARHKAKLQHLPHYLWLRHKYRKYTMSSWKTYVANLALIGWRRRRESLAGGAIVECGTWRGGMSFSMADLCPEAAEVHCFDSFEGLPPAGEKDGEEAQNGFNERALTAGRNEASMEEFKAGQRLLRI